MKKDDSKLVADPQTVKRTYKLRPNGSKIIAVHGDEKDNVDMCDASFASECDVNNIMDRFMKTGQLPQFSSGQEGIFADVSGLPDYATSLNMVSQAKTAFEALDAKLRLRFGNDPAQLIAFLEDADNIDEAIKLGLVEKPKAPEEPAPTKVIITNPEPTKTPAS